MSAVTTSSFAQLIGEIFDTIKRVADTLSARIAAIEQQSLAARVKALEDRPFGPYEGTWDDSHSYACGAVVTYQGSLWLAQSATGAKPGQADEASRVATNREKGQRWKGRRAMLIDDAFIGFEVDLGKPKREVLEAIDEHFRVSQCAVHDRVLADCAATFDGASADLGAVLDDLRQMLDDDAAAWQEAAARSRAIVSRAWDLVHR